MKLKPRTRSERPIVSGAAPARVEHQHDLPLRRRHHHDLVALLYPSSRASRCPLHIGIAGPERSPSLRMRASGRPPAVENPDRAHAGRVSRSFCVPASATSPTRHALISLGANGANGDPGVADSKGGLSSRIAIHLIPRMPPFERSGSHQTAQMGSYVSAGIKHPQYCRFCR